MSTQTKEQAVPQIASIDDLNHSQEEQLIEIYHPSKEEVISTTGHSATITCVLDRLKDPATGFYIGEIIHPVTGEIAHQVKALLRTVKIHGCHSDNEGLFFLPEKKSPRGKRNTWNTSLGNILDSDPGLYFSIQSDRDNGKYVKTEVKQSDEVPTFDDFEEQLLKTLRENVITSMEHPVIQKLLGK